MISDDSLMQKATDEDKNRENYDNIENSNKCKGTIAVIIVISLGRITRTQYLISTYSAVAR